MVIYLSIFSITFDNFRAISDISYTRGTCRKIIANYKKVSQKTGVPFMLISSDVEAIYDFIDTVESS